MTQELDALIADVALRSLNEKHSAVEFQAGVTPVPVTGFVRAFCLPLKVRPQ